MEEQLVTIVVPVYNVEKYLNRCIESLVNQTYRNLEIILVDDGSPDNCPIICDEWADKDCRIKVIHKTNAGLGMARNSGIDCASGKYIFFFDSDDYVDVTIVEKCVLSARKHDSDVVIYGRCEVYEDGRCVPKEVASEKDVFVKEEVINDLLPAMFTYDMGFGVSAWGKMFSLDTIRRFSLRFVSEREIISEDAYFSLEYFSNISKALIINECLYFYYKREDSLSRSFRLDRHKQNDKFLQKTVSYARDKHLPEKVVTHLTARYHMYVVASMKQLLVSDLPAENKTVMLNEMFRSTVLRTSINTRVIKVHATSLKVFFALLKFRCYLICKGLLYIKLRER